MALHITQMFYGVVTSEFPWKFCLCNFFGKASLVMTFHLHQFDTISYHSLEPLKPISCKSIKSYFPAIITDFIGFSQLSVKEQAT